MLKPITFLIIAILLGAVNSRCSIAQPADASTHSIAGTVKFERPIKAEIQVWAMRLQVLDNGQVVRPTKQAIFAASVEAKKVVANNGEYSIPATTGPYCVFAFADANENGSWDPGLPEPMGWFARVPSGGFDVVQVESSNLIDIDFTIRAPRHFTTETRTEKGGTLRQINGYTVLQLRGDAKSRGYAHGKLVAPQIVDFFRFYILEDKMQSAKLYEQGFAKFLNTYFAYPENYVTECKAVIEGMHASGEDLFIPELNRDFSLTDLYAINGYIETRAMRSSCTQFAAWGERTTRSDVDGGMITGRNMDGEVDIRKVTVSHFLLFAVDPEKLDQKRYVSMMWPGFVATISGMNEEGFYTMENAGLTGPPIGRHSRRRLRSIDGNAV